MGVMQLERAFTALRKGRKKKKKKPPEPAKKSGRRMSSVIMSPFALEKKKKEEEENDDEDLDEHSVYASDLVRALGVNKDEAEEMIFIADLQDNQAIDFTEFKQIVVNWS